MLFANQVNQSGYLATGDVEIWVVALPSILKQVGDFAASLSNEEVRQAQRFSESPLRARYVSCRCILRRLLGGYLGVAPRLVQIKYGAHGKPALSREHGSPRINFNLSHAGNFAVYAFSYHRRIGVDVEPVRALSDREDLAAMIFTEAELSAFNHRSPAERDRAFFHAWCSKEAVVKGCGTGLHRPLSTVTLKRQHEGGSRLATFTDCGRLSQWHLAEIAVSSGYVSMVALEGREPVSVHTHWL